MAAVTSPAVLLFLQERRPQSAGLFLDARLGPERRKTGWVRAEAAGDPGPWRQQALLGRAQWDANAMRGVVRDYVVETLAAPDAVLVVDETGFLKQGKASCGAPEKPGYRGSGSERPGSLSRLRSPPPDLAEATRTARDAAIDASGRRDLPSLPNDEALWPDAELRKAPVARTGSTAPTPSLQDRHVGRVCKDPAPALANFSLAALPDAFYADPFPIYRTLREQDPIRQMPDGSYFLTRYRDIEAVYKDAAAFSSDKKVEFKPKFGDSLLYEHHTTSLVFNDPPLHTRVRRLMAGALNPRAIAAMEPGLVSLIDGLLDRMEAQREADLIEEYAAAIPVEVIGNLLGVPREDRGPLRGWSLAILGALEPALSTEALDQGNRAVAEFLDYLRELVAERRRMPGEPDRDVLTRLIIGESDGEALSEAELLQNCIFILNAGHETTTNLIGNGLELMLRFPEERQRLIARPDLLRSAIEEILRYESSNQLGNRRAAQDSELGGVPLPQGTLLTLCIGAANRDPEAFPDPDRFDVGRQPNRHLAFASGPHVCAGLNLARLEGRVALGRFLARFPAFEAAGTAVRARRARFRGFASLPVRLRRR